MEARKIVCTDLSMRFTLAVAGTVSEEENKLYLAGCQLLGDRKTPFLCCGRKQCYRSALSSQCPHHSDEHTSNRKGGKAQISFSS